MPKDMKVIVKIAEQQGWTVRLTRGGHVQFVPADPTVPLVVSSSTPSDHRTLRNLKAQLRRSGLAVA